MTVSIAARRQGPRPAMPADLVQRFVERGRDMSSSVERVASFADVPAAVARYLDAGSLSRSAIGWAAFAELRWADCDIDFAARPATGDDAIGITGCFCAIAETGTLVFVTSAKTPSATFLLPDTHIAIVGAEQIVPGMEEAFVRIRRECGAMPRAVNLVSGPSRTGDIEQTIVLGAHGPRRVHIVVVGQVRSDPAFGGIRPVSREMHL
jgi:L-lactate dehydrogenase complex protein LldG